MRRMAGYPTLIAFCLAGGVILPVCSFAQQDGAAHGNRVSSRPQESLVKHGLLPDTGQTNQYTQTFGEDSDFSGRAPLYTDNGDGTVTDQVTGLIWQKTDGGEMTWEQAKDYARKLSLGGAPGLEAAFQYGVVQHLGPWQAWACNPYGVLYAHRGQVLVDG